MAVKKAKNKMPNVNEELKERIVECLSYLMDVAEKYSNTKPNAYNYYADDNILLTSDILKYLADEDEDDSLKIHYHPEWFSGSTDVKEEWKPKS